jgi:hypothetical protein
MSAENIPIELNVRPNLDIPTRKDIRRILESIADVEAKSAVEYAIESTCSGELPQINLPTDVFGKLKQFIDGTEIASIYLYNDNAMVGLGIKVLAFAREDGAIDYRRTDDIANETTSLATLSEVPSFEQVIQMVTEAIEGNSGYSWQQQFMGSHIGDLDHGAHWTLTSSAYPGLAQWFQDELDKYLAEFQENDED